MTTYLTIITTILVLTQIIRITQNYISLFRQEKKIKKNSWMAKGQRCFRTWFRGSETGILYALWQAKERRCGMKYKEFFQWCRSTNFIFFWIFIHNLFNSYLNITGNSINSVLITTYGKLELWLTFSFSCGSSNLLSKYTTSFSVVKFVTATL